MTTTPHTRTAGAIIRCPHCQQANRVRPSPRGTPRCGSCHRQLPWLVDATDATLDAELGAAQLYGALLRPSPCPQFG